MSILGAKVVISGEKQPNRPKIDIIEDFDALKCNFLSIFAGMATRVHTQTQYFGYIQVKISQGAKKTHFWCKNVIFLSKTAPFSQCLENFLSGVQNDIFGS